MPNDDTLQTADKKTTRTISAEQREFMAALAKAQLDPMFRIEPRDNIEDICDDGDDYDQDGSGVDHFTPHGPIMSMCPHCNQRSVPVTYDQDGLSGPRCCENCGPLECHTCESTLRKRSSEATSAGFELYCSPCETVERFERARLQEHEERFFDRQPRQLMRRGKTARDRENRAIRERAKRAWKSYRSLELKVGAESIFGPSIAIALHITEIRLGCAGNCEIRYHATTTSPGLQAPSVSSAREQTAIISSMTKTIPISFWRYTNKSSALEVFTINVKRWPEIKALLRDLGYLTPETRWTLGKLSGSERREEESLCATPTCEPRNQDEERSRHRGHRCGTKRTPWTHFRKARALAMEARYREEFEPRPQTRRKPSDLERENAARHIELPAYKRKDSRSSRMTVSRTCAYGYRPVHSTIAEIENRTVRIKDEPMHLLESREPLLSVKVIDREMHRIRLEFPS